MLSHRCDWAGSVSREAKPGQRRNGGWSGNPIDWQPCVSLEVSDSVFGLGPEDAIDPTAIEPEAAEQQLQFGNIVAAHHGSSTTQEAFTEVMSGFVQRSPGFTADDACGLKATFALECGDRIMGNPVEPVEVHGLDVISSDSQETMKVNYVWPYIAAVQSWARFVHGPNPSALSQEGGQAPCGKRRQDAKRRRIATIRRRSTLTIRLFHAVGEEAKSRFR